MRTSTYLHSRGGKKVNSYAGYYQHTESVAQTDFRNAGIRIIPLYTWMKLTITVHKQQPLAGIVTQLMIS
jgi:hypothetical protein